MKEERQCEVNRECMYLHEMLSRIRHHIHKYVQSWEKRLVRSLVKFVPALACLFCLALLGTRLVESAYLISEPCRQEIL